MLRLIPRIASHHPTPASMRPTRRSILRRGRPLSSSTSSSSSEDKRTVKRKKRRRGGGKSNNKNKSDEAATVVLTSDFFRKVVEGPPLILTRGRMANQTHASLLGSYAHDDGSHGTTVLTTVAAERASTQQQQSSFLLTAEYRERHHAVGRFPRAGHRRDNRMLSLGETLASRALDRALRPLVQRERMLIKTQHGDDHDDEAMIQRLHVSCSLQAMRHRNGGGTGNTGGGDALPLAINTAAAALRVPVAAVSLGVTTGGTVIQDATMTRTRDDADRDDDDRDEWLGQLLYAGTTDGRCVMMEWGTWQPLVVPGPSGDTAVVGLPDDLWSDLLDMAQGAVERRLETVQAHIATCREDEDGAHVSLMDETTLRASLGFAPTPTVTPEIDTDSVDAVVVRDQRDDSEQLTRDCLLFCEQRLTEPMLRLFGWTGDEHPVRPKADGDPTVAQAFPMEGDMSKLIKKSLRSKLEGIVQKEVESLTRDFLIARAAVTTIEDDNDDDDDPTAELANEVYHRLMRRYLYKAAVEYGCRSDGRKPASNFGTSGAGGWNTVRPIQVTVPALPDAVHGSAHFARGETGVLATVTLASPKEGLGDQDPFDTIRRESREPPPPSSGESGDFHSLPVGSLRFLRTQEALVSDLNSRNSRADKERTGSSGSLAELRRAFVQYDFPGYSTGQVPTGNSNMHNRRALGHGALAEKALLPVLPTSERFPYAIRITSETVDSNGSSSMATICGSYLALIDAGVPMLEPVAGVSVGLAMQEDGAPPSEEALLLDITGTEDYFGKMDFKIGGTRDAVTALQLDVKEPVETRILSAALKLARAGRNVILDEMQKQLENGFVPRLEPKLSAPAVEVVKYDASRKRDLIGPGGVVLRQLEDRYNVSIDLTQEGRCLLYGEDRDLVKKAKSTVMDLVADVIEGEIYEGTIVELKDFGAVVELLRNKEALLHVSELTDEKEVKDHPDGIAGFVRDNLKVGETIDVQCIGVDPIQGSIKVSRKAVLRSRKSRN